MREVSSGNYIYLMNADGTRVRRLVRTIDAESHTPGVGSWSPDSRRIVFECPDGICSVNADGSGLRQLAKDSDFPAWSPDGRWIAFHGPGKSYGMGLYVMKADGSQSRRIAAYVDSDRPAWRPTPR